MCQPTCKALYPHCPNQLAKHCNDSHFYIPLPIVLIPPFPECDTEEESLASTLEAIAQLPAANKDTLAFLILHVQRVASRCDSNKMPLSSMAKIFGPAIVGHASANPKDDVILADTKKQPVVMMKLLGISSDYWKQYMSECENPVTSPTPSVRSSPGMRSPATPELRPGR